MKRLQAYKYELRPNGEQRRQMAQFAGSVRFVYNKALALQKEWYAADKSTKFSYSKLANLLPIWKKEEELTWLKDNPAQALQQALKDLERSYVNFFQKRADFPKFKKKGVKDSFRYPQGGQIKLDEDNNRIFLPKLGFVRYRKSRNIRIFSYKPINLTKLWGNALWSPSYFAASCGGAPISIIKQYIQQQQTPS